MTPRRTLILLLALVPLAVLSLLVPVPAPWHPPRERTVPAADSQLVREYPLGERPLCCGRAASSSDAAAAGSPPPTSDGGGDDGSLGRLVPVLPALALAAGLGLVASRFTRQSGVWLRVRPRRRWHVGPTVYRWARGSGFRYSARRDALVLRALGGRFGPVLTLRADGVREPSPTVRAWARATADAAPSPPATVPATPAQRQRIARPRPDSSPGRAIDVACRLLPHRHHEAELWQLTAVELQSRFVWAELVRRRGGPPTAQQIAGFLRRIAADLRDRGERLDAVDVPVHVLPVFDGVALPTGVRLVVPEPANGRSGVAAEVHELLVARHWRAAFVPPAAPPLKQLRGQLRQWVAAHNAERDPKSVPQRWVLIASS